MILILFRHFRKRWPRINKQRERKLGKFDLFTRLSFVWRTLLIHCERLSHNLMENKKEAGMSINKYNKASSMDAKEFT